MSLVLKIESELDERSATAAANRAERVYAEASRNISKSMSSQIGDGAQAAGKAVEKMADSARASYQKVLKAQDELAQQERQLKQMREDGARGVEVQAERVRQARKAEKDAVREAAGALNEYERATQRIGESGLRAGAQLRQGLRAGLQDGVSDYTRQFGVMGNIADNALSGISTKALVAGAGIGAIAVGAIAATRALYDLGAQWDDISDSMTIATGKTGDELDRLTKVVGDVGSTTGASLGQIGQVTQQLAQNLPDLEQNNAAFRLMVSNLSYLNAKGVAVDVREMSMAFRAFGIDAGHQVQALDDLNRAAQNSGIPLNELISTVRAGAPQFRQFGLSIGQSTSLLASFSQAGVAPEAAVTGLRTALKNVGGEGKVSAENLGAVITQIKALHDVQQEGPAQQLASDTFGTRGAAAFLQVIENGTLDVQSLNKALQDTGLSLAEQQRATNDWSESLQMAKNTIGTGLKPVADFVFGGINSALQLVAGNLGLARDNVDDLTKSLKEAAGVKAAPDAVLSVITGGQLGSGVDPNAPLPYPTTKPTTPTTGLAPSPYKQWYPRLRPGDPGYAGNDNVTKSSSSDQAQVPYAPGYGAPPRPGESTAQYQAEQSVLEAQHRRAEAEAQLAQVMATSTHTTNDEIKAQNDVAQAKKAEIDANMRLHDTSVKAAESLNKATSQLSEFGAGIDADFGISKGLPGIVENITKMLGNFALAGPMAQLNAISAANPNQGSGLMGMLASTGAFGPQYTPQALAAGGGYGGYGGYGPSALGPAALRPGGPYPGDAALLSHIPKGIGEYDNVTKDLSKGLVDCASGVEDLVNIMDGKSTAGGSLWTGNAASVLPQMGFLPGMGGPGDFRIGYRNGGPGGGHMQATLPGGTNVNFGSTSAIRSGGLDGSAGAYDPSFTSHYYRPAGGAPATVNGGGAYTPLNPTQPTDPGLTSPTVAGSPGQGFPLPWNLGGGPLSPAFGPAGPTDPFGPDVSSPAPGQIGPFAVPGAVGAAGNAMAAGRSLVNAGRSAEPTQPADPYGVAPATGPGGGGIGITPGGSVDTAIGIAASAANLFAPGAGAAAQAGIKLASRAIQYGGQVVGIAADGLLQTFLPAESQKAQSGWLQRGIGGLASVKPALPNLAGGKGSPNAQSGQAAGQGQQPGQPVVQGGDTNINVTNNQASEDQNGKTIAFHLGAQNQGPGW